MMKNVMITMMIEMMTIMILITVGQHNDEECDWLLDGWNLLLGNWSWSLCRLGKLMMMFIMIMMMKMTMMMMVMMMVMTMVTMILPRNTGATLSLVGEISLSRRKASRLGPSMELSYSWYFDHLWNFLILVSPFWSSYSRLGRAM